MVQYLLTYNMPFSGVPANVFPSSCGRWQITAYQLYVYC